MIAWFFPSAGVAEPLPDALQIPQAVAQTEEEMQPYAEIVRYSSVKIEMVPIRGGTFAMGSSDGEADRDEIEGPSHMTRVDPFWMAQTETTWDAFEVWMYDMDIRMRRIRKVEPDAVEIAAEEYQLTQPTKPYCDMTFGMGKRGYPAICMTQFSARVFCMWLSEKTGRYYRLPTEAEWEYACRAGTSTAYSFGDDPADLDDYAWYFENSDEAYQKVGKKEPNPWSLYDMHGNVAEWVLDQFKPEFYAVAEGAVADNPLAVPEVEYPRIVRGGSWDDDPETLRSAARGLSSEDWKMQDPNFPKSIWYHTDALHVGFRIVRPLNEPTAEERAAKWDRFLPQYERKSDE